MVGVVPGHDPANRRIVGVFVRHLCAPSLSPHEIRHNKILDLVGGVYGRVELVAGEYHDVPSVLGPQSNRDLQQASSRYRGVTVATPVGHWRRRAMSRS
jgi:hypothetical protein